MISATNFNYNGTFLSDYNLMICSFDTSESNKNSFSKITYSTAKAPKSIQWQYQGSDYSDPFSFTVQIGALDDKVSDGIISSYDERLIGKWLNQRRGYREFYFEDVGTESQEWEKLHYFVIPTSISVIKVGVHTVGFEIEFTANSTYGFTAEKSVNLSANTTTNLFIDSDSIDYINPKIVITSNASGTITLANTSLSLSSSFQNVSKDEVITLDKEQDGISTSLTSHNIISDFNHTWFKIHDGTNAITVTGDCNITLTYREARKVAF